MAIRSDDITTIIRSAIEQFDAGAEVRSVGTVVEVGDGIAQIYGLADALASELLEFPDGVMGMALNLEEETVGAVILGDYTQIKEGDTVKTTGRVVEDPGRPRAARSGRRPARTPTRRQGAHQDDAAIAAGRTRRSGRHHPPVRRHPGADRHQGHRRAHPHRPWPARVDHRRPPDGQDRGGHRHDHQPEGEGPHLHLRRRRAEALDGRQDGRRARAVRRDGPHHRRRRRRRRTGSAAVHRPVRRCRHRRGDHGERGRAGRQGGPRRAVRLRRPDQARMGLPRDVAAAPPPTGTRGVSRRRVLPPQPPARACRSPQRGLRRRIAHRAAHHRDAGQ